MKNISQKIDDARNKMLKDKEIQANENKAAVVDKIAAAANKKLHGKNSAQANIQQQAENFTTSDKIAAAANNYLEKKGFVKDKTSDTAQAKATEESLADRIAAVANKGRTK